MDFPVIREVFLLLVQDLSDANQNKSGVFKTSQFDYLCVCVFGAVSSWSVFVEYLNVSPPFILAWKLVGEINAERIFVYSTAASG